MRAKVRQAVTSTLLVKLDEHENLAARALLDSHANIRTSKPTPMRVYEDGFHAGRSDGQQIRLGEELEPPAPGPPTRVIRAIMRMYYLDISISRGASLAKAPTGRNT